MRTGSGPGLWSIIKGDKVTSTDVGADLIDKLGYSAHELGFDPDELKARYLAERDKRLREDGNEQYVEEIGRAHV